MSPKLRLDQLLVQRGLAPTRARAQALILAGHVLVNDQPVTKAGAQCAADVRVTLRQPDHPYVGRGGVKLAHALETFAIDVRDSVCLDSGASTGGFTDCLLQHGARQVYAVDVGHGQLAWKLQQDPRVVRMDQTNLRTLDFRLLDLPVNLVTLDLSFISLTTIFPVIQQILQTHGGVVIALIKPQFEAGRAAVGKGGIVRDVAARTAAVEKVLTAAEGLRWQLIDTTESPIHGADGNVEFLAAWRVTIPLLPADPLPPDPQ